MRLYEIFPNEESRQKLVESGLTDFQRLWELEAGWFEPPNERRGGWSGVSRYQLKHGEQIFIKRQHNHFYRPFWHLFQRVPTFVREFHRIRQFEIAKIPSLQLMYFGKREINGDIQAILITLALSDYLPLNAKELLPLRKLGKAVRRNLIEQMAMVIRLMHLNNFQHNCLYPKHIFVRINPDETVEVKLIDLEKVKWRPNKYFAMLRDLDTLHRHADGWTLTNKLRFFLAYRKEVKLSTSSKKILRKILHRSDKKIRHD